MTYEEFIQTPLGKLMTAQQAAQAPEMSRQEMLKMMQKGPKRPRTTAGQEAYQVGADLLSDNSKGGPSPFDEMRAIDPLISAKTGARARELAHKLPMGGYGITPAVDAVTSVLQGNLEPTLGTAADVLKSGTGIDMKDMLRAGRNPNANVQDITKESAKGGLRNAVQAAALEFGGPLVKGALTDAFPVLGRPIGEVLGLGKKVIAGGKPGILSAIEKDASNPSGTHYVDHGDGSPKPYAAEQLADASWPEVNNGGDYEPHESNTGTRISADRPDVDPDAPYGNEDDSNAMRKILAEEADPHRPSARLQSVLNAGRARPYHTLDADSGTMFDPEQFGGDRPEPAAEDLVSPNPEFTPDTRSPEQAAAEGPNERLRRAGARQQEVEAISRQLRGRDPRSFGGDMGTNGAGRPDVDRTNALYAGPRGPGRPGYQVENLWGDRAANPNIEQAAFRTGTTPPGVRDAMGVGSMYPNEARYMTGPVNPIDSLPGGLDSQQMAARDAVGAPGDAAEGPGLFTTPPEREPLADYPSGWAANEANGGLHPDDPMYGRDEGSEMAERAAGPATPWEDYLRENGYDPDSEAAYSQQGQDLWAEQPWDGTPGGIHPALIDPTDESTWPSAMGPDEPTGPNFPPGMKGPGEPGYIPDEISGNDPNAGLRPTVNPLERIATAAIEKFKAKAQGNPGLMKTLADWTDGISHALISGFGQSRSAAVQFNKGYHGPMEAIWDLAHSHFTDALGLDPWVADNMKQSLQGTLAWDTLTEPQRMQLRAAADQFNPVTKEIKAMSQYLLDTGRITAEEMQQHGDMYIRRHLAMFDPATRGQWRPPLEAVEPAIDALLRRYNYEGGIQSRQQAMKVMADWEKAAHTGQSIQLPGGEHIPVSMGNGSIFMQKTDLPPEVLKWMGELTHGGLGLLRTMGDMAMTVHASRTADGIFSHIDQIRMESPSEPVFGNGRPLGDALNASEAQRRILGPLANEQVPRAVGEMFQNVFGMQDGTYRLANQYLRGIRLGTMGLNPATHLMWGMNDATSMVASGVNPFNPMNAPYLRDAASAVAAYHVNAEHPVWASLSEKIPGFDYETFKAQHLPVYEQLRNAGAFRGAGGLKLEATHAMAEAFHDLMIGNGHETPGSQVATFLNAPIAATERTPGLGYMLKLGPEIMEGTSQIQQAAVILKAMDGIRLKDFGPPVKMSLDDAILHKNDFFYQSQETGQMLRQMKGGVAGVLNAARGFTGINYAMDVMTKQLPNTIAARPPVSEGIRRAYLQRPLGMALPALGAVALHNWGWTMGGWGHQAVEGAGVPEGFNPFVTPSDARQAAQEAARSSYKYRFPHGIWVESPFKAPFGGSPSKINMAGGLPEYMLLSYERKLGNTVSEDLGGWASSVIKNSLMGGGNFASPGDVDQGEALGRNKNMSALLNMAGNTQPGHLIRSGRDVYDSLTGAPMSRFNFQEGPTRVMLRALANIDTVSAQESVAQGKLDAAHTEHEIAGGGRAIKLEARKRAEDPSKTEAKQQVNKARVQRAREMLGDDE